jgi:type IV pilus assembly protein PilA
MAGKGGAMGSKKTSRGISLLEVVIAFAITSILVAATMPNLHDYSVRARVEEGLMQAIPAQNALVAACMRDNNAIIKDNLEAGYQYVATDPDKDFVDRVVLAADCAGKQLSVMVWTFGTGAETDPIIEWMAKVPSGVTSEGFEPPYYWNCRVIRGDFAHVPADCRKTYRKS